MKLILLFVSLALSQFNLVFQDNFQSLSNWVPENMAGAQTGNNEWQHYTDRSSNIFIGGSRFGNALHIVAKKEQYNGHSYTSGRLHSARTFGPYGFYNVRAVVPKGNGVWPAIWLLPPGARTKYGGWAACGEIDIMETVCAGNEGYSTLHFGGEWPKNRNSDFNNKWGFQVNWAEPHWYGVDWQPDYITFYVDATIVNGQITGGQKGPTITSNQWFSQDGNGNRYPSPAPFDQQFMFILNVAIGGSWPCGVPGCCQNTPDSAEMLIFSALAYTGKNGQANPQPQPQPNPGSYCTKGELSTSEGQGLAYPSNFQGYQSNDGGRGAGVSPEVCQAACDRVAGCTAVSYSSQYQLCYLKSGSSCSSSRNANNFVTYWKTSSCSCNGSPQPQPQPGGCGKCCHSGAPYKCTSGPAVNGCSASPWANGPACSASCRCESFLEENSGIDFERVKTLAPTAALVIGCIAVVALIAVVVNMRRKRINKVDTYDIPLTLLTDE